MENVLNRYYDKNGYLKVVLTPEGKDELQVAWNNGDMDFEVISKCWYYINDEEYWVKNDFNFFGTIQYMVNCYVEDKDLECLEKEELEYIKKFGNVEEVGWESIREDFIEELCDIFGITYEELVDNM